MLRSDFSVLILTSALIYNPVAGTLRRDPVRLERTLAALRATGLTVTEVPTTGPDTAGALARQRGEDLVIGLGGDGTLHEIAAGLVGTRTPFLPLPGGTANVVCMETGIGRHPEKAAAAWRSYARRRIAVGKYQNEATTRHFLAMAGCGLDAHIVEHLNPALKKRFGKLAYWLAGFQSIMRWLPEFPVRVDGREYVASLALVTRVRNYGGDLEIARSVRLSDEDFEIVLFRGRAAARYALYLAGTLTNTLRLVPGATVLRGREVEIADSPHAPIYAQLDGEAGGRVPGRATIVPDALTILLPESYGQWTT